MSVVIDCKELSFLYGSVQALKNFSLTVERGEVIALLGPNGAGKTTSIRVMTGLLRTSSGRCQVLGLDPRQDGAGIRAQSGVLTETPALYERLTGWQNLEFFGTLAGLPRDKLREQGLLLLDAFKLTRRADDRVETFSKGMKQRLAMVRALLHEPQLLFLDEPTSDLDPEAARQVQDLILEVTQQNQRTVLLCTHRLHEAERLCDRVAIMRTGSVVAAGTLDDLRRQIMPEIRVNFRFENPLDADMRQKLSSLPFVNSISNLSDNGLMAVIDNESAVPAMVNLLVGGGMHIRAVEPQHASLEDIYLKLQENEQEMAR